ncbi:hypothetical protein FNV43_RR04425 [Rhamnella rubrinervis]|uniref:DUF1985 domain-containing protein n=1 Tax=Rhamnella rubrinervis TaxID=2594499 RepID=A0A8K0MQ86_9ROSA|nr:hypothetical protein FNV43_RR04425 [Rhamnella rubrinervis]
MVFNFGGSGARFTIQEFCLISGLFCGPVPTTRPTTSGRFRDTYFSGRKFPLHNHDIVEVFSTTTCENDDDMVKLALLYFLETVILSKEKPTPIPVERVDMLDDIKYFLTYPWGTLSYNATVKSMRGCPGKRSNASHTYSITGFPIAFMVWGYETIPSLAEAFGIKSSLPRCPRMRNWTISGMPKKKILEDIFAGRGVVGIMVPKVHERLWLPFHHLWRPKADATPLLKIVGVDLDPIGVIFDPYRPTDEIADNAFISWTRDSRAELFWITVGKNYFRDMECSPNWLTSDHMETVTHLIRQRADKYPEVFDSRILVLDNRLSQYMEARLDLFNKNKSNYDFGEEMLEFLNGKEPMMKIKPCWEYDRVFHSVMRFDSMDEFDISLDSNCPQ